MVGVVFPECGKAGDAICWRTGLVYGASFVAAAQGAQDQPHDDAAVTSCRLLCEGRRLGFRAATRARSNRGTSGGNRA